MTGGVDRERLEKAMADAKVDQSELARRLGVTPGTINQILTGRTQRSRYMPAIANELHVSLRWLMGTSNKREDSDAPALTVEEQRLLFSFRQLDRSQKDAVQKILESMISNGTLQVRRHDFRGA